VEIKQQTANSWREKENTGESREKRPKYDSTKFKQSECRQQTQDSFVRYLMQKVIIDKQQAADG
jgi:hypothetical protein